MTHVANGLDRNAAGLVLGRGSVFLSQTGKAGVRTGGNQYTGKRFKKHRMLHAQPQYMSSGLPPFSALTVVVHDRYARDAVGSQSTCRCPASKRCDAWLRLAQVCVRSAVASLAADCAAYGAAADESPHLATPQLAALTAAVAACLDAALHDMG